MQALVEAGEWVMARAAARQALHWQPFAESLRALLKRIHQNTLGPHDSSEAR
ncbi:MAG: hypothetical protein U1E76_13010 [Planctomycetota bacterium]